MAKKTKKKRIKKNLNKLILVGVILLICYLGYINKDKFFPKKTQGTTIIVNGEIITSEELDENYMIAKKQNNALTKEDFLDQVIILKLLLQEADKEGIGVEDNEIDNEINSLIKSLGSAEELDKTLDEISVTKETLRTQIKKQLLINKLINKTIITKIKVSDSEIKSFYDNNKEVISNISFDDIKDQIRLVLINEKKNSALETYIKQLRANANIKITNEEITELKINRFQLTTDEVCKENNKPIIRLFSTTTCSQCALIKNVFDSAVKELVKEGEIIAYHWELDIGDNTLTQEKEDGIPLSEVEIFRKYNTKSTVPTYIFGCKYVRIGNAYEKIYLEGEKKEIEDIIKKLII